VWDFVNSGELWCQIDGFTKHVRTAVIYTKHKLAQIMGGVTTSGELPTFGIHANTLFAQYDNQLTTS